jgi:hypothetical protein
MGLVIVFEDNAHENLFWGLGVSRRLRDDEFGKGGFRPFKISSASALAADSLISTGISLLPESIDVSAFIDCAEPIFPELEEGLFSPFD